MHKSFDVFLSYKSEDIHVVRQVAEQLIANDYRVWFAEYQILIRNYNKFQRAIDQGTQSSNFGICFTNDRYIGSEYCRREIEQLLDNCTPDNIIEVCIPTEPQPYLRYPELAKSHSAEHITINDTLKHIVAKTGKIINAPQISEYSDRESRLSFYYGDHKYSLDCKGWEVEQKTFFQPSDGDIEGPKFTRHCNGFYINGNLIIGNAVDNPRAWGKNIDDRKCYEYGVDFANYYYYKRWIWRLVEKPIGLHLLFLHKHSHIGFTCKTLFNRWTRRYSIVLPLSKSSTVVEFAFIFFFHGPFTEYCRYAYLMDELVESLELYI